MEKNPVLGGTRFLLLLLFFLPGDVSTSTAEPQYLVLVPFLVHTETLEKICVQFKDLNESVTLSVTAKYEGQNRSLIREVVSETNIFKCTPFQFPKQNDTSGSFEMSLTVVVKGPTLEFSSSRRVLVKNPESLPIVQTDKPMYKAGQKVTFRIACLDKDLLPLNEKYPLVYIQDPHRNRVFQWQDVELKRGLTQLSFPLASEPVQGTYKVVVQKTSGELVEQPFDVEEYVLPRFEVLVKTPKVIMTTAEELEVTVCGMYTYGKAVPGLIHVQVCRRYNYFSTECYGKESEAVCEEFSGKADGNGCISQAVKTRVFHLRQEGYEERIHVEGKITEEGTGVELTGTGITDITATLTRVTLEGLDTFYKRGIPLSGQIKLVDGTDVPIANANVTLSVGTFVRKVKYTTDAQGQAEISIDTTNFTGHSIHIEAYYKSSSWCGSEWVEEDHQSGHHTAYRFYSPSESYLHIDSILGTVNCGEVPPLSVNYVLNPDVLQEKEVIFNYLVVAKGFIVQTGTHILSPAEEGTKGVFLLNLSLNAESAPFPSILLYSILPNGELLADSYEFPLENCFRNKVKLWFSDPEVQPAGETQLHIAVSSPSLCAVHAVDKSVFLLKPEAELSSQTIYNSLPVKNIHVFDREEHYLDEERIPCVKAEKMIVDGISYQPEYSNYQEGDAHMILKSVGMSFFTSTKIYKPKICRTFYSGVHVSGIRSEDMSVQFLRPQAYLLEPEISGMYNEVLEKEEASKRQRRNFPETWLFDLHLMDDMDYDEGMEETPGALQREIVIPVTAPDTITEWKTGVFCMSQREGFGMAQPVYLRAFQHFFLELTLPYSIVRGEEFTLKATVFTYQQHCIRAHVSLDPSPDFTASLVDNEEEDSHCLCANERKTLSWTVVPKSLGKINFTASAETLGSDQPCENVLGEKPIKRQKDTIIRSVLVEPEGIQKQVVFNSILSASENAQLTPISLELPKNVVEGSARASFCVLGDMLGSAIQNLHQLLQMPHGCGEQNMALFAPNIYILDYLNKTGQLTEEIRSNALKYLVTGYQTQLRYKHPDGSYSTFGPLSEETGNTWLTAFVLKSFGQARSHIFVDEQHIADAQASLAAQQKENGCFRSFGSLLNNALKGGLDDEVKHSAYITSALLEISLPVTQSLVRNALFCLEREAQTDEVDIYTRALLAYVFTLAEKEDKRKEMLQFLEANAVKEEDGSIHWQQPREQEKKAFSPLNNHQTWSADIVMTSYVLLTYVEKKPAPSPEEMLISSLIVKWLNRQQNPTGGFLSTQDTVMALQALSKYSTLVYSQSRADSKVSLSSGADFQKEFHVDSTNSLLLQCQTLPKVPGNYQAEVTGGRSVLLQTTLKYNVHPDQEEPPFKLDLHTVPEACMDPKAQRKFALALNLSYTGQRANSNMVIVDVKMLSGFIPVKSSVQKLQKQGQVKRTEVSTDHVLLYLEEVTSVTQHYSFMVEQEVPVQGLKPAFVTVYDYYEPDEKAVAEYSAPCSTDETKLGSA